MDCQRRFSIAALAIIAALFLLQSGCSVVGLGIGAAIDAHKPDSVIVQGYRLTQIEQGTPLTLTLTNGSNIAGTFNGGMPATAEWIDTLYTRARANDPGCSILPALGDTVELLQRTGRTIGRIKSAIYQHLEPECDFCYGSTPVNSSEAREFCLKHLLAVRRSGGDLLRSQDIADIIMKSRTFVPYSGIEVITPSGVQQTPLDCISRVVTPNQKHGKRDGLIIGITADVVAIVIFSVAMSSFQINIGGF